MPSACEKCANEIAGEVFKCGAFCSSQFCSRCSGLTEELKTAIKNSHHVVWMCTACKNLLAKARFTNAMISTNATNDNIVESLKKEVRDGILNDLRQEIRSNFKSWIDSIPSTPIPRQRFPSISSVRSKRQREVENDDDGALQRPTKLLCGTGACNPDSNIAAVPANQENENKFWLYLSNIHPNVSDEAVANLVHSNLGTDNTTIIKLVPRGKDVHSLTFVSYKIGMVMNLKAKAMCSEIWPSGKRFREFEDIGKKRDFQGQFC